MDIYLPIAHIAISLPFLAILGLSSGFLSGLYGIGGGVIAVPLMIFGGLPVDIAVATSLLQIVGVSFVNVLRNMSSKSINYKIGIRIVIFSSIGSVFGVFISNLLHSSKHFTPVVSMMYIILLATMALVMLGDVLVSYFIGGKVKKKVIKSSNIANTENIKDSSWNGKLKEFEEFLLQSGVPVELTHKALARKVTRERRVLWFKFGSVGTIIGILSGIMGIGGGAMSIPAIVYLFNESIVTASMTSSFIALFTTLPACIMQMHTTSLVEPFIAIVTSIFAAFGVRVGNGIGRMLPHRLLKLIFACILIIIGIRFGLRLFSPSFSMYDVNII